MGDGSNRLWSVQDNRMLREGVERMSIRTYIVSCRLFGTSEHSRSANLSKPAHKLHQPLETESVLMGVDLGDTLNEKVRSRDTVESHTAVN